MCTFSSSIPLLSKMGIVSSFRVLCVERQWTWLSKCLCGRRKLLWFVYCLIVFCCQLEQSKLQKKISEIFVVVCKENNINKICKRKTERKYHYTPNQGKHGIQVSPKKMQRSKEYVYITHTSKAFANKSLWLILDQYFWHNIHLLSYHGLFFFFFLAKLSIVGNLS